MMSISHKCVSISSSFNPFAQHQYSKNMSFSALTSSSSRASNPGLLGQNSEVELFEEMSNPTVDDDQSALMKSDEDSSSKKSPNEFEGEQIMRMKSGSI